MGKAFYNLDDVRSISILDVCETFGVSVEKQGKSHFCKLRSEKTASCKLNINNIDGYDTFHDFGSGVHGDVIKFVAEYLGCDWQRALEELASSFNIAPVNNTEYMNRNELTDIEYKKIGVYGDLATKNFDFDLEKYSFESAQKYSEKFAMTVNQLRKEYPSKYAYEIIKKRAIPHVYTMRNDYYFYLYTRISFQKSLVGYFDINNMPADDLKQCTALCKKLIQAEALLKKALRGTDIVYSFKEYDVRLDLKKIFYGEISFEIGERSYAELKKESRLQGVDLRYRTVSVDDYLALNEYGINSVLHAAFLKDDKVNLTFLPEHSEQIDKCIDLYRKSQDLDKAVSDEVKKPDGSNKENRAFEER